MTVHVQYLQSWADVMRQCLMIRDGLGHTKRKRVTSNNRESNQVGNQISPRGSQINKVKQLQ